MSQVVQFGDYADWLERELLCYNCLNDWIQPYPDTFKFHNMICPDCKVKGYVTESICVGEVEDLQFD